MQLFIEFENPVEGTLLGNYIDELFRPIKGLSEQLKGKVTTEETFVNRQKRFDFKHVVNKYIQETSCSEEVQEQLPSWQYDYVQVRHLFTHNRIYFNDDCYLRMLIKCSLICRMCRKQMQQQMPISYHPDSFL